jgi:hypothetical protein
VLVRLLDYLALVLFLGLLGCIVYSWIWWHRTGRQVASQRRILGRLALVYSMALPVLLMGLLPMCNVPLSYAMSGIPFAAVGVVAALLVRGQSRVLLIANAAGWYALWVLALPIAPTPC